MTIALLIGATCLFALQPPESIFEQSTVASHEDHHQHRWPCIGVLEDNRLLLTWSRTAAEPSADAVVYVTSNDHGRTWSEVAPLIAKEGFIEADPKIEAVVVLFGDSTTALREGVRVFKTLLRENFPTIKFINAGIGSNTTDMARERFERDVLAPTPDAVTIFFGLNDAAADVWRGITKPRVTVERYAENLRYFVRELRDKGALPILLTPNPLAWTEQLIALYGKAPYNTASDAGFNILLAPYVEAARRIAKEEDALLIDVNRMYIDHAASPGHSLHDWLLDGMHPNSAAHEKIAAEIAALLKPLVSEKNKGKP